MLKKEQNQKILLEKFSKNSVCFKDQYDEINIEKKDIVRTIKLLKENENLQYDQLIDLTAIDYPSREKRFDMVYILLSMVKNKRILIKTSLGEEEGFLGPRNS